MSVSRKGTQKKEHSGKEVKVAEWADTQVPNSPTFKLGLGEERNGSSQKSWATLSPRQSEKYILLNKHAQFCPIQRVPLLQTSIVKENDLYVNRVECDTAFDFDRVEQILISEPIPCPIKPGYNYV